MNIVSEHSEVNESQALVTYTARADESPSEAVVIALQNASNRPSSPGQSTDQQEATCLTPLFETVDPDALDALFTAPAGTTRSTGIIEFTHDGYDVTVTAAGDVTVSQS